MVAIGIAACDESKGENVPEKLGTIRKRLVKCGIPPTDKYVTAWRWLVAGTPDLGKYASAIILEESVVGFSGYVPRL